MNISTVGMSKEEWLKTRKIGGSYAGAILGLNNFMTPLDVYNEILGVTEPKIENPRMKAGKKIEGVISDWYEEETGNKVLRDNKVRFHKDYDFLSASLDRLIQAKDEQETGILECKNTNSKSFKYWEESPYGMPAYVYAQIQHYFDVAQKNWGCVAVLIDGWDFRMIPVERDKKWISESREILIRFWNENILKQIPPEPKTKDDVLFLFPKETSGINLEVTERVYNIWETMVAADDLRKDYEERTEGAKQQLQILMLNAEWLSFGGKTLCTWKADKDGKKFDVKKFQQDNPNLYEQYCNSQKGIRRFLINRSE